MPQTPRYLWRVYCINGGVYETVVSETEPTECPSDGGPIDSDQTVILDSIFNDIFTDGYINIESALADNQAIKIIASDSNGGIDIDAGFGGITIDSTNTISLDAAAASNFTTTSGNLELEATNAGSGGLINIDADSGINLGSDASTNATNTSPINIGTSANAKNINIGNLTSTTRIDIHAGTGGFLVDTASGGSISLDAIDAACNFTVATSSNGQDLTFAITGATDSSIILSSQGIGTDSIRLDTAGGIDIDASGRIDFVTSSTASDAYKIFSSGGIDFDCTGNYTLDTGLTSSISLVSGSAGILLNTASGSGGAIGIGNNTGGDIFIGNAAVARTIFLGNNTSSTRLFTRFGTGGNIESQIAPYSLPSDANDSPTTANLLTRILVGTDTLTADRTITLPSASDIVSAIGSSSVNDCFDFTVVNQDSTNTWTIASGTNGTTIGNMVINTNDSSLFRIRITNVTGGYESYEVYRIV